MPASIQCPRRALATAVVLALAATGAQAAMITVADGGDSGSTSSCTLRQAIAAANSDLDQTGISTCTQGSGNDLIVFDGALQNSTITLSGYQLEISTSMTISGTSQTLDGAGLTRVLLVQTTWKQSSFPTFG